MLVSAGRAVAQASGRITLTVQESAGIRRTQFPAQARVPFAQGTLRDPDRVRLTLNQTAVAAQAMVERQWPDGSVRELVLDFNASPGPNESLAYTLEYGDGVTGERAPRGLSVAETPDGIQVGNISFGKSGAPLVTSVKYRDEAIGAGINSLVLTDIKGADHTLADARDLQVEILKRGPLVVSVKYTGSIALDASARAPFTLAVAMPSSKSWVTFTAHVDDPGQVVKTIAIATPLALGPLPWVWDFGTSRWTYGSFRSAADRVMLTEGLVARVPSWTVTTGAVGREQPFETARGAAARFGGWGHFQGAKEVVAFAIDHAPEWQGTTRVSLDGQGQARFALESAPGATRHDIAVTQHFVAAPVQIGAATSPAAILSPLTVSVGR